jgi:hypothetical protein
MTLKERLATLEAVAERTDKQNAELEKVRADIAKEDSERAKKEADDKIAMEAVRAENAELKRVAGINEMAKLYNVSEEIRTAAVEDKDMTDHKFARTILDAQAKATEAFRVGDVPNKDVMLRELGDVMSYRLGADVDLKDNSFRGASLFDIAKKVSGVDGFGLSKDEIAQRAMVTTDFPLLLIDSGNRSLEKEFDAQAPTARAWIKEVDLPDFRINTDITRGGAGGRLEKVAENGELKERELSEAKEKWSLESFGNKFTMTRQMIINDDLGAFNDMLEELAILSSNLINGSVYDMLRTQDGYVMDDGKSIFHADHNNVGNTALSPASLAAAKTAMRKQVAQDGTTKLNITPTYLIVAPELEYTAYQILNSTADLQDNKNSGVVNPLYKSMQVIVDAELATATEWYLVAGRRTLKAGYLQGSGRRPILRVDNSSMARTSFEGIFDFGLMAEDYRGVYKGK